MSVEYTKKCIVAYSVIFVTRISVGAEAVDDERSRVRAGDEVEDDPGEREDGEEGADVAVGVHHVEPLLLRRVARDAVLEEKINSCVEDGCINGTFLLAAV